MNIFLPVVVSLNHGRIYYDNIILYGIENTARRRSGYAILARLCRQNTTSARHVVRTCNVQTFSLYYYIIKNPVCWLVKVLFFSTSNSGQENYVVRSTIFVRPFLHLARLANHGVAVRYKFESNIFHKPLLSKTIQSDFFGLVAEFFFFNTTIYQSYTVRVFEKWTIIKIFKFLSTIIFF